MLDKVVEIGILFDFYGKLLTDKQQEAIILYYYEDLSLSEIAERLEISRQGVYDHLHRSEEILREYEKKLGHIKRYKELKTKIEELDEFITGNINNSNLKGILKKKIREIKKHL